MHCHQVIRCLVKEEKNNLQQKMTHEPPADEGPLSKLMRNTRVLQNTALATERFNDAAEMQIAVSKEGRKLRISDQPSESATMNQQPKNEDQRPIFWDQRPHVGIRDHGSASTYGNQRPRINDHMLGTKFLQIAIIYNQQFIEGSLETKLPTISTDGKASHPRRRSEMEKVRREKMQVREKVGKSRNTVSSNVLWLGGVEK